MTSALTVQPERRHGVVLAIVGLALVALGAGADFLVPGPAGYGFSQKLLMLGGAALILTGGVLTTALGAPIARRFPVEERQILSAVKLVLITFEVAFLIAVIRMFRIESPAFYDTIGPLVLFGFVIHHLLPARFRLAGFAVLSLAGIFRIFGFEGGAWLVGLGVALIGICHLPIHFWARVGLVTAAGGVLAAMRVGWLPVPWPGSIWPIFASMFMFRLIVYLHHLKHSTEAISPARSLSYFFLLPNVAFPLFPVVDFATFKRTHYDRDAFAIYQDGVRWMARGLTHLIAYRYVYHYQTLSPADVTSGRLLVHYMVANFLLYLRVSGQFHLIVGILHLFGFRLPATHRFFYLASSFTDFWRRINVYWKDFMMTLVYNPTFFALRKKNETAALVISTLLVFFVTWFLHLYQWFWLLGSKLISWTDTLFWAILAVFLVGGVVREARQGRQRALPSAKWPLRDRLINGVKAAATFTIICSLWTLWTSPTLGAWADLMSRATFGAEDIAVIAGVLLAVGAGAAIFGRKNLDAPAPKAAAASFLPTLAALAPVVIAAAVATPQIGGLLGEKVQETVRDVRIVELNRRDAALLQRSYYEQLVGVNRFSGELWDVFSRKETDWPTFEQTEACRWRDDFLRYDQRPLAGILFHGQPMRVNRWGMRDRDYQLETPPNTFRMAIVGSSFVMGHSVADNEVFDEILEESLNRAPPRELWQGRYELMNFGVSGYGPLQKLYALEKGNLFDFRPDTVFYFGHLREFERATLHLFHVLREKRPNPYPELESIIQRANISPSDDTEAALQRLDPFKDEVLTFAYNRVAELCRARGVKPVWIYVPMPTFRIVKGEAARLMEIALAAGFTVHDLSSVYERRDPMTLAVAPWDLHPNAEGHRLIAEQLRELLIENPELISRAKN